MKKISRIILGLFIINSFNSYSQRAQSGWFEQENPLTISLKTVHFIDNNIGFAGGDYGKIVRTTNGGNTWLLNSPPLFQLMNIWDIVFLDKEIGFAFGLEGTLGYMRKTTNGGESWDEEQWFYNDINPTNLFGADVYNINSVICVGGASPTGVVGRSTDLGSSWYWQYLNNASALYDVCFADVNTVVAVGYAGNIWRSTDNGLNWTKLQSITNEILRSVHFPSSTTGFICGDNGTILKTTNSGQSWSQINTCINNDLNSIFFLTTTTGFVVGELGKIYKTINGGDAWGEQVSGSQNLLRDVYFTNTSIGYVVGDNAIIEKTVDGGGVTQWCVAPDKINYSDFEKEIEYISNFPNPFNPSTKISFSLKVGGLVTLKVYDILGVEIATLINEYKSAGNYNVEFDASHLFSGIYIYKFQTGNFIDVNKMMLLK